MRLVFMGPPGVGKGTQAARIAEALSIPHIATGDMFRRAIREETPMGRKAKPFVDEGKYVPDEIVNGIVEERLSEEDCARGFVLDGFPRTLEQARALEEILKSRGKQIDLVIDLQVGDDEILSRLTGRRVCP
ncbi:MAG: nucleoside monophosphate kinase, partial [Planifilum fulgidum]